MPCMQGFKQSRLSGLAKTTLHGAGSNPDLIRKSYEVGRFVSGSLRWCVTSLVCHFASVSLRL